MSVEQAAIHELQEQLQRVFAGHQAMHTRTCVTTCGRGAGTHGDVLNVHTEVFGTDTRGRGGGKEGEGGVTVSSANHETAHVELSRASERFTERNPWFLPIQGLRTGREQHVPDSSNHSLYLMKLLSSTFILRDTAEGISTHNTHLRTNTHSPTHRPTDPPTTTPLPSLSLSSHTHTQTHMYMCVYLCMCVFTCPSVCAVPCNTVLVCAARSQCGDFFLMVGESRMHAR